MFAKAEYGASKQNLPQPSLLQEPQRRARPSRFPAMGILRLLVDLVTLLGGCTRGWAGLGAGKQCSSPPLVAKACPSRSRATATPRLSACPVTAISELRT